VEVNIKIGKTYFFWVPKWNSTDLFEDDPQYDSASRNAFRTIVREEASVAGLRAGIEPVAGYVHKASNTDYYVPCGRSFAGARPAWIWYAA
jgi:hypothetical protein